MPRKKWINPPDICNAPGVGNRRCWLDLGHRGHHADDSSKPWKMPAKRGKRYRTSKKSKSLAKRRRSSSARPRVTAKMKRLRAARYKRNSTRNAARKQRHERYVRLRIRKAPGPLRVEAVGNKIYLVDRDGKVVHVRQA